MNDNNLKIEVTADGSATIFVENLNEHYHSVKGALAEAEHIYRDCAFLHRASDDENGILRVLEIGFGTGLNALVTAHASREVTQHIHYITLEKYPLSSEIIANLEYGSLIDKGLYEAIHQAEWNTPVQITSNFTIEKRECDFTTDALPTNIDVVYYDAFAPEKQPEMWTPECFARVYEAMAHKGILTTYCAKGAIRRSLQSVGFSVLRMDGPVGGKREILRAEKL